MNHDGEVSGATLGTLIASDDPRLPLMASDGR